MTTVIFTDEGTIDQSWLISIPVARTQGDALRGAVRCVEVFSINEVPPKKLDCGDTRFLRDGGVRSLSDGIILSAMFRDFLICPWLYNALKRRTDQGKRCIVAIREFWTDPRHIRIKVASVQDCALYVEEEAA
ncbi:MAG: hypothetical protein A2172_03480 [Candidatus Woykebacteria bacterium RBG_13_40_15]|uniref:Uncharacterized protein n=1 Tax=Candidatus Woykebacteria bacterium RBG_13_40_15 TaxID=1802593 RepID=A0A1G1W6G8_9BACT|nr:MAG: hypothetical protein A2172_03480 [Candidatus Woykebacteria bacterium RBG_13_40_15]